ncbi:MAG: PEP-CTERM sorting domain-containing protein [Schlesneria sp.]
MSNACKHLIVLALVLGATVANAGQITRQEFSPNAINYGFESATFEATTASDGVMTVSQGTVSQIPVPISNSLSTPYIKGMIFVTYSPGAPVNPIKLEWSSPISAVGIEILTNLDKDVTLELFDGTNQLLESLTILSADLTHESFANSGFIGIDYGTNRVASALISGNGTDLQIDSVVYQSVPEPGTFSLLVLGLCGLAGVSRWRR